MIIFRSIVHQIGPTRSDRQYSGRQQETADNLGKPVRRLEQQRISHQGAAGAGISHTHTS
jgi:hypothetical protein